MKMARQISLFACLKTGYEVLFGTLRLAACDGKNGNGRSLEQLAGVARLPTTRQVPNGAWRIADAIRHRLRGNSEPGKGGSRLTVHNNAIEHLQNVFPC